MTDYEKAIEAHNVAGREYASVLNAYRAMKIGDEEFLAAKDKYAAATVLFDAAFTLEARYFDMKVGKKRADKVWDALTGRIW